MSARDAAATGTVGATIPSWGLRVLLGLVVAASAAVVVVWTSPPGLLLFALCVFGVLTLIQPGSHLTTAYLVTATLCVLAEGDAGVTGWTFLAVLALHAVHSLGALAGLVPLDGDVERAALAPSVRRFLMVQSGSQVLALLAFLISG